MRKRHEASALRQAAKRRADMPGGRVAHRAGDIGRSRERRVHHHGRGRDFRSEIIADLLGVETRHRNLGKQAGQNGVPGLGKLVQRKRSAGDFGVDGKKAGACRRLQHGRARRKLRGMDHQKAEAERRRELLEFVTLLAPARVRGQKRRKPFQHGKIARGAVRLAQHAGAVFAQEQNGGGFGRFIGVFPKPGAVRVAGLEGSGHRLAENARVERCAAFERRKKLSGGFQDAGCFGVAGFRQAGAARPPLGEEVSWLDLSGAGVGVEKRTPVRRLAWPVRAALAGCASAPETGLKAMKGRPSESSTIISPSSNRHRLAFGNQNQEPQRCGFSAMRARISGVGSVPLGGKTTALL